MNRWRDELLARLAPLRLRPEREAEIIEELSQDLDDRVRALAASGVAPADAEGLALAELDEPGELARQLGTVEGASPRPLPAPGQPSRGRWLAALWQDVHYACRTLARTPAFALTVVATLALTIGPTTAILSVGNWLIWRPPPGVAAPDRLAVVWFGTWRDDGSVAFARMERSNVAAITDDSTSVEGLSGWEESTVSIAAGGAVPRFVGSGRASVDFLPLLGVYPVAGRGFTESDDSPPSGSPVILVSDRLARDAFGSPADAIGRSVSVNGRPVTVVGVLPAGFVGVRPFSRIDVWFPRLTHYYLNHFSEASLAARPDIDDAGAFNMFVARLRPGISVDALQAELDVRVPALAARPREGNDRFTTVRARAWEGLGARELSRDAYAALVRNLLIVGGVLLVLGAANVTNLLLVRGVRLRHERALRLALGASRSRLVQLVLVESCVLAAVGAIAGIGLAVWLKDLIQALLPGAEGQLLSAVPLDTRVLLATLAVSLGCGLAAGVLPAWLGASGRLRWHLGHRGLRQSRGTSRLRAGFGAIQFALSLALVTNAVLLTTTIRHLTGDPGFDPRPVSFSSIGLIDHGYDVDRAAAYSRDLLERLSSDPRLSAASLSQSYPSAFIWRNAVLDPSTGDESRIDVQQNAVTDGYFRTLDQPLVAGRAFTRDEALRPGNGDGTPVVISESLARRLFGSTDAVGRPIRRPGTTPYDQRVIGVAKDVDTAGVLLGQTDRLVVYLPFAAGGAFPLSRPVVLARSDLSPGAVAATLQAHASAIDLTLPVTPSRPLSQALARELGGRRVVAWVLSLLGALGFVLAAVGLSGLLAQMVSERTREFGIRMAVGASRAHVLSLVLRQSVWIAAFGTVGGLALAAFGSRLVESQLYGVGRLEPWVYLVSAGALGLVVLVASHWPARTATQIEPVEALRSE